MNLSLLSNEDLISKTEKAVRVEREATTEVVRLFQEIWDRKLYLKMGFPSLYEMVTRQFGYCAGSAMRRINSMRLIREIPEVESKLKSGELSLTVVSEVQSFFYAEAKEARPYSLNAKIELLETCLNKSKREVEIELCKRNPERERRESLRPISNDRLRMSFSISDELNEKIDRLKDLMSHTDPNLSAEHLLEILVELGLNKYDPIRKANRATKWRARRNATPESQAVTSTEIEAVTDKAIGPKAITNQNPPPPAEVSPSSTSPSNASSLTEVITPTVNELSTNKPRRSRYIKAREKHRLAETDDGLGCGFVDSKTGRRCGSKRFIEMDHVTPFSYGGANTAENLQAMCSAHNRLRWVGADCRASKSIFRA